MLVGEKGKKGVLPSDEIFKAGKMHGGTTAKHHCQAIIRNGVLSCYQRLREEMKVGGRRVMDKAGKMRD